MGIFCCYLWLLQCLWNHFIAVACSSEPCNHLSVAVQLLGWCMRALSRESSACGVHGAKHWSCVGLYLYLSPPSWCSFAFSCAVCMPTWRQVRRELQRRFCRMQRCQRGCQEMFWACDPLLRWCCREGRGPAAIGCSEDTWFCFDGGAVIL